MTLSSKSSGFFRRWYDLLPDKKHSKDVVEGGMQIAVKGCRQRRRLRSDTALQH